MTLVIVMFVLLASTPLLWNETQAWSKIKPVLNAELQVQVESWGGQGFLGQTVKRVMEQYQQEQKSVAAKIVSDAKSKVREANKDVFMAVLKDADIQAFDEYGTGDECYPLVVRIPADKLSAARAALRAYYGSWTDKVEEVSVDKCWNSSWTEQKNYVVAKYLGPQITNHYLALSVRHEMDAVPKGLLKPGCKIEQADSFTVTCAA